MFQGKSRGGGVACSTRVLRVILRVTPQLWCQGPRYHSRSSVSRKESPCVLLLKYISFVHLPNAVSSGWAAVGAGHKKNNNSNNNCILRDFKNAPFAFSVSST